MADGSQQLQEPVDLGAIAEALRVTKRGVELRASREKWPYIERAVRGGRRRFYAVGTLPIEVQTALMLQRSPAVAAAGQSMSNGAWNEARIEAAWSRYELLSNERKATAQLRLRALVAVEKLVKDGHGLMEARESVAAQLQHDKDTGSARTLRRWAEMVDGCPRGSWLAALVDDYAGRPQVTDIPPEAWDWYVGHYLNRRGPTHADTYSRLEAIARSRGWVIPCGRTFARRIEREIPRVTLVAKREGPEAAARLVPTMQRDALCYAAGQAVNGDGLKFDKLWVRFEDGEIINTATGWFWQDIRSRKILAWRIDKTENTDLFRLATYDLTAVCAPEEAYIDNTRVAANKLMTAGAKGRHRFKSDPSDGMGLLVMLGIDPRFTNPDKDTGNPGAKPIERAFGKGGLHEMVATNPRLIDRGYSKDTAIDVAELREVVAHEVARFNAREKRETQACRGILSFDQAWAESRASSTARVLSEKQRRLLLLSREVVTADKRSGELRIAGGRGPWGQNAYWCEHLVKVAGQKLAVHFDPDNLSAGAHVYSLAGEYLFFADHVPREAFNDTRSGREWAKFKERVVKGRKAQAENEARMSRLERDARYRKATDTPPQAPEATPAAKPVGNVVNGHFQRVPDPVRDATRATGTDGIASPQERSLDSLMRRLEERQLKEIGWKAPEDKP